MIPFTYISRILVDEIITIASSIREVPISDEERRAIHNDFGRITDALSAIIAAIPREQLLLLFPENKRRHIAALLTIVDTINRMVGK